MVSYTAVQSVLCTLGATHCCAICTVHCWCHTLLCHLYCALFVLYNAVPSVLFTADDILGCAIFNFRCWCHTLLCQLYVPRKLFIAVSARFFYSTSSTLVNCLVSQSALFCCLPFCSTQFLSSSTHHKKPDTLPHNVLLSKRGRAFTVRLVIQLCVRQNDRWSCESLLQQN
jgi:hypothetical protein